MEQIKLTYRYAPKESIYKFELAEAIARLFADHRMVPLVEDENSPEALFNSIKKYVILPGIAHLKPPLETNNIFIFDDPLLEKIVASGPLQSITYSPSRYVKMNLLDIANTKYKSQSSLVSGEVDKFIKALHILSPKYTLSHNPPKLPVIKTYAASSIARVPYFYTAEAKEVYIQIPEPFLDIVERYCPDALVNQDLAKEAHQSYLDNLAIGEAPW